MGGMSEKIWLRMIKAGSTLVAMVLIWRLVETALKNDVGGVIFFIGVAALAGLGGYEIRWLADAIKPKTPDKEK